MAVIPRTTEDFTVEWMNSILRPHLGDNAVTGVKAHASDIPGQTAEVVMLNVDYTQETKDLPRKMVAKITSQNPQILEQLIANYDQYRRETSFYREFPDIGIPVPKCLHQDYKPETEEFIILMSDLAPARCPSWAISTNEVETALSALPGLHGQWWNKPILMEKDWMVRGDDAAFFGAATTAACKGASGLSQDYDHPELTQELMFLAKDKLPVLLKYVASRQFTFVHGDYHAKQMFFPTDQGGEFTVIDWQFPFVAPGAWDFARLLGMCMDTSERESREQSLLRKYLDGLISAGVKDYNQNDLEQDYRYGLFVSQIIMCVASADTDVELLKSECGELGVDWQDAMIYRTQAAIDHWNVLDFIKSI